MMSNQVSKQQNNLSDQEIWFSTIGTDELSKYDVNKAYMIFRKRIAGHDRISPTHSHHLHFAIWRYAAAMALLIASSFIAFRMGGKQVRSSFAQTTIEAPAGSRTKLTLPDGTLAWLNAGSYITYSQGFGVDDRKIQLTGEGYFEVRHNEKIPFIVSSSNLRVKVLGTKFDFRDYPGDSQVVVSLLEGKVALQNLLHSEKDACLSPNQQMVLDKNTGKMRIQKADVTASVQWLGGFLFFDEIPLSDIAKELERYFNVRISFADETLKSIRIYGRFILQEQDIRTVMDALTATGRMNYSMNGKEIMIIP